MKGQTMVEYLLVMSIVLLTIFFIFGAFEEKEYFFNKVTSPAVAYMKYNYKYGDKDALGWDERPNAPRKHIQMGPGDSFRLFIPE